MIAILFMKEISERLPNKNIRLFCGKPLFYWVLTTLSGISIISKIVIDTDSYRIASMVHEEFPDIVLLDRPENLIGNHITANALIRSIIDRVDGNTFVQTHVTNPLLTATTIKKAIAIYENSLPVYDSLLTVTVHKSPFYFVDGTPVNHNPSTIEQTQKIKSVCEDNSNLYIFSRETFNENGRIGKHPYMYPINKLESIDIDTEEDWKMAELLLNNKGGE
jgi:CMP-N-acetylneuraminic acid synthetase